MVMNTFESICPKLGLVIFKRESAEAFRCLSIPPDWLLAAIPEISENDVINPADHYIFLSYFLVDRKSTRLNSSHSQQSRMPSSA